MRCTIKIFIADHFFVVRAGIKAQVAHTEIEVVGEAVSGRELQARLLRRHKQVDLVLLEVGMPEFDPLGFVLALKLKYPTIKVFVLTEFLNAKRNAELVQCGVNGIMLKTDDTDLAMVLRKVGQGESYFSPEVWHWRDNGDA